MKTRAQIGRENRYAGEDFEKWIDGQHVMAGWRGILAHVVHNEPKSEIVYGKQIWTAPGAADYTGVLHGGGVVAVEAKSTKEVRLARAALSPKQQHHLEMVSQAGGLALLLVEFRRTQAPLFVRYAIPWREIPWKKLRSADTVSMEDIKELWLVAPDTCYLAKFHPGSANRYAIDNGSVLRQRYPTE